MEHERIPFPEITIKAFDMLKGLGEIALNFVTKQMLNSVPSEHFHQDKPDE